MTLVNPVSPVFESLEALADWCEDNADMHGTRWTGEQWLTAFRAGDLGSTIVHV